MAKTASKEKRSRDQSGWQAQKSAMMRDTILDAALDCFINIGYASHHHRQDRREGRGITRRNAAPLSRPRRS